MSPPVLENVPLAPRTTLGVGGPARYFAEAENEAELERLVAFARERDHAILVLGGGSNLLVADRGFDGLAVRLRGRRVEATRTPGGVSLVVEAGHGWDDLVALAVDEGWAGLECLSGIPGNVGAAPMQNIGAYGQEIAAALHRVRALDVGEGSFCDLDVGDCGLGYRTSHFKERWRGRYVITAVELRLLPGGDPTVRYPELAARLRQQGHANGPTLADVRAATLAIRRGKSMVLDENDPNRRSAGSFFTNPLVDAGLADAVADQAERMQSGGAESMPRFAQPDGRVKLSAAWLIERCGFSRGYRRGRAGLSSRHVLAVINRGGARAEDLVELAAEVRTRVADTFGVVLSPEPVLVGFEAEELALLTTAP